MTYTVHLRCNATGEVRALPQEGGWLDDANEFMWTEGNYACDCNRHLFFHRAAGIEPDDDMPCGETAYTIVAVTDEADKQIHTELPAPERDT